jgi:preprotein translocase subunit SecY
MFAWLANVWRVPELRRRLLFTAGVLAVYRLGSFIPAPGVDQAALKTFFGSSGGGGVIGLLNLFSGSALSRFSLFALGIMPYVTASIIFQVMAVVVPSLERLQKEGEAGYAKITQYTRYLTVALAAAQATGYAFLFKQSAHALPNSNSGRLLIIILTLTAGTTLLMWMGEQITKRGIGNGISIIIFASILAYAPAGISGWLHGGTSGRLFFPLIALGIVVSVVFVMEGQRRIPIQYARRQLGNRQTGGQSTYMPLSVVMAGVIPIIFASAILAVPQTIGSFKPAWNNWLIANFSPTGWKYLLFEAILIILMTYFYTSVVFNPVDQADNLRKYNGYIPGIRPGPPTAAYFDRVLKLLTFPGALFLAAVAVAPSIFINQFHFNQATYRALGGTSVLIVVGVALQTMRQMESQMVMRHYEGFLR